jgi:hypothetical protein
LHQDHKDHEQRDENVESKQDINQNGHRDGQYRQPAQFVNGGLAPSGEASALESGVIPSRADGEGPALVLGVLTINMR